MLWYKLFQGGYDMSKLDKETVLELWSKTYNTDGKPDWSHIFPYYHEKIVFQDTIQRIEGIDEFIYLDTSLFV